MDGLQKPHNLLEEILQISLEENFVFYLVCSKYWKNLTYCDSTRVSNELGAGHPNRAKNAIGVSLKLSLLVGVTLVLAIAFGHNIWASFFSDSSEIIKEFASMTPLLAISIFIDSVQAVISGLNHTIFYSTLYLPHHYKFTFSVSRLMVLTLQGWPEDMVGSTWLFMLTWRPSISLVYQLHAALDLRRICKLRWAYIMILWTKYLHIS